MTFALISLAFTFGALTVALIALLSTLKSLHQAEDRIHEVEDKMLLLAGHPEAVIKPIEGEGSVTYMDERREAELDASTTP